MLKSKAIKVWLWLAYLAACAFFGVESKGATNRLSADAWQAVQETPEQAELRAYAGESVCRVRVPGAAGSGSLVEVGGALFVLTNHHVVENDRTGGVHAAATVEFDSAKVRTQLTLAAYDRESDLAVLEAESLRGYVQPLWVADEAPGGAATVHGHPLAQTLRARNERYWNQSQSWYGVDETGRHIYAIHFSGDSISGESGGPLVNDQRQVVAVLWGGGGGVGRAVPLPRIHNLLRRIFQRQCYGGTCRPAPRPIPRQPASPQRPPNIWINPQINTRPPQQPAPAAPITPVASPPTQANAAGPGVLLPIGAGVAALVLCLRERL